MILRQTKRDQNQSMRESASDIRQQILQLERKELEMRELLEKDKNEYQKLVELDTRSKKRLESAKKVINDLDSTKKRESNLSQTASKQ